MRIPGSTVLLTGASGGIGNALAHALAGAGANLILTGRNQTALNHLAAPLQARVLPADLADRAAVEGLAALAGDVDILIANAALPSSGELLDYTPEQTDRALEVNLRAPVMLARLFAPAMVERGRGHLVMIGSISGQVASPAASLYNATKYGLRGFTQALRQDLHRTGVGVSLIQPGFVRDAGMFAETGVTPPGGSRTVSPQQVAQATVSAIEGNRGTVNVAPLELRLASAVGGLFPTLAATVQRRVGKEAMQHITWAQRAKR